MLRAAWELNWVHSQTLALSSCVTLGKCFFSLANVVSRHLPDKVISKSIRQRPGGLEQEPAHMGLTDDPSGRWLPSVRF